MSIVNLFPNKDQFDTMNMFLAAIASQGGGMKPTSWKDVQTIVRQGLASKVFAIGDQLVTERLKSASASVGEGSTGITSATVDSAILLPALGSTISGEFVLTYDGNLWRNSEGTTVSIKNWGITAQGTPAKGDTILITVTGEKCIWDVIGFDHDSPSDGQFIHSMTLGMHDCFANVQFDNTEALFYADEELAAGTYNFTLLAGYDTTYGGGKTYQFTLTKAVPVGGVIMFPWGYQKQASATSISTYATQESTEVLETVTVTEGAGGTSLESIGECNHTHRIRYGSNNYNESAIRQWANSDKAKGTFWVPQTKFDRPPTWETTLDGFLYGMDSEFVSILGNVKKRTALNTVSDGGGYIDTDEKVFLLSRSEVYGGLENSINEGNPYPYYANYSSLASASTAADVNRIKYLNGSARYWWLRSPIVGVAGSPRYVYLDGYVYSINAYHSYGAVPACCII